MNNSKEIWKDIQGYEGLYQVSNLGNVRSVDRTIVDSLGREHPYKGQILKPMLVAHGYLEVNLSKGDKRKPVNIHRLVAKEFIPNPHNLPEINHIDENKQNNAAYNLEWCTSKYNANYGTRNERVMCARMKNSKWQKAIQDHTRKLGKRYGRINGLNNSKPVLQYSVDGKFIKEWVSMREVKRELSIDNCSIARCCNGKQKTAGHYIWKFK